MQSSAYQGSIETLTQELDKKTTLCDKLVAGLHQVGEQIKHLQESIPAKYRVLCANILLTISEVLGLTYHEDTFLSRGKRLRAVERRKSGTILPSVYNRIHGSPNMGIQLRDFILIHNFLNYICVESSETQHLPSMLFCCAFMFFFVYAPEKILRHVSEISEIESPLSTDLLPPSKDTQSVSSGTPPSDPCFSDHSSKSSDQGSNTAVHNERQPIFLSFLTEAGKEFLYTVLSGDEDLLNVSYKSSGDQPVVCLLLLFYFLYLSLQHSVPPESGFSQLRRNNPSSIRSKRSTSSAYLSNTPSQGKSKKEEAQTASRNAV